MKTKASVNTPKDVRKKLDRIGKPISAWARENGYTPSLVYEVLRGRACKHGKSHEIAVLLGMKDGEIERRAA